MMQIFNTSPSVKVYENYVLNQRTSDLTSLPPGHHHPYKYAYFVCYATPLPLPPTPLQKYLQICHASLHFNDFVCFICRVRNGTKN